MTSAESQWIASWWKNEGMLDACDRDVTTQSVLDCVPALNQKRSDFYIHAKKAGVFSGRKFLDWIAANLKDWSLQCLVADGQAIEVGQKIVTGTAPLAELLARERMILNMVQHLSGIASATSELRALVQQHWKFEKAPPAVLHTRKFLPGLRQWQTQACLHGGGESHRRDLGDRILFKDNHKKLITGSGVKLPAYYEELRKTSQLATALIEVETVDEGLEAVACGVQNLLLDNFSAEDLQRFFLRLGPQSSVSIELSGNLNAESLPKLFVDSRIQRLSFGSVTHSVRALDISLEILE